MNDKTNPKHYQLDGFQVIDLTEQLGFCQGNVVKYVCRAGKKEGESTLDDLFKAKFYLDRLINKAKRENAEVRACAPVYGRLP